VYLGVRGWVAKVPLGLDMDLEVGVDAQVVAILSYVD